MEEGSVEKGEGATETTEKAKPSLADEGGGAMEGVWEGPNDVEEKLVRSEGSEVRVGRHQELALGGEI